MEVAPDGTRREAETCRYDGTGRKTKVRFVAAEGTHMGIAYGVEGTEHAYGAPGATTSTLTYDDRDLPDEVIFHDANHALVRRIVFSRDRDGRLLTEVVHFGGGDAVPNFQTDVDSVPSARQGRRAAGATRVDYQYDTHGNWTERVVWRRTPEWIRLAHVSDQRADVLRDRGPAVPPWLRLPAPVDCEGAAMPSHDCG